MGEKGKLDSLRNSLHQADGVSLRKKTPISKKQTAEVPSEWKSVAQKKKKKHSLSFMFFIVSILFFIVAIIVAVTFFLYGGRTVSPDNLTITTDIPGAIASGEPTSLRFSIRNTNPVSLPFVRATVSFPEGSKQASDITSELTRITKNIGPLNVGEEKDIIISAVFFGEENEKKSIQISIEYRGEDSSAVVVKEKEEIVRISSAPVSIAIDSPQQLSAGDSFTTTVSIRSNSTEDISNLSLLATYPFGFTIEKTVPQATLENTYWNIGTLQTGETKKITIQGSLEGVSQGEKAMTFSLGTDVNQAGDQLSVVFAEKQSLFTVVDSVLAMSVSLSGSGESSIVAGSGQSVQGRITYSNTLDTSLFDVVIEITLNGDALDLSRVNQQQGFYRSSDKTIVFNRDTNVGFRILEPGSRGSVVFKIPVKSGVDIADIRNPEIGLVGRVSARQINAANVPIKIVQTFTRSIQVRTELLLSETIERTVGAFINTGPWPLKVDSASTFTVRLRAENTTNTLANTEVSIELPSYVSYTGVYSPQGETVSYNDVSKKLRWTIDSLSPDSARTMSFQISAVPSSSQLGKDIVLVKSVIADGFDRFVKQTISATLGERTSKDITDPEYSSEKGVVTQ